MAICRDTLKLIPSLPGVYRFYNKCNEVIYIGKAKNLRARISQYFHSGKALSAKTTLMVSKIEKIEHIVVNSEHDAFLLENNLIKEYQPRYNIMLKDSKSYPWIVIKNEPFPRIFLTRDRVMDGSLYFGPYSSVKEVRELLELILSIYKIRGCKLSLTAENILSKRYKPCLKMHLNKCHAPCIGRVSREEYLEQIENIKMILNGESSSLIGQFRKEMLRAALETRYEDAQIYKENIEHLERHYSKSLIVNQKISEIDVFSLLLEDNMAFGNFMRISKGAIVQSANVNFVVPIEEERGAVMSRFIAEIKSSTGKLSDEILVEFMPDYQFEKSRMSIPKKGDKFKLLELSVKNAKIFKSERVRQESLLRPEEYALRVLTTLKNDLKIEKMPYHIECFDNSNIQGSYPVSACVVFKNGAPSKKDYRHFIVKTVTGANDFETMQEVVTRRYSRLLNEQGELPDLLVIDGGKGQLTSAYRALKTLGLDGKIYMIGIAERLEELIVPGEPYPLFLDKNSSSLRLIMNIRNEAHRFGIAHHRKRRSKGQIVSALREIPGIGIKTEIKLLSHFKSINEIRNCSADELSKKVGKGTAKKIKSYLS